jgi:hypothetical protein
VNNGLDPNDDGSGDPTNGATGDPDLDNHGNLEEFQIGSDPQDFRSRPVDLSMGLVPGFLPVAFPLEPPADFSSFDLVSILGDDPGSDQVRVDAIQGVENGMGPAMTSTLDNDTRIASGDDFPVAKGEGVFASVRFDANVEFQGPIQCEAIDLAAGVNLVSPPCLPTGYSAFAMLQDIGTESVIAGIQRFNADSGRFESATYAGGVPAGSDFLIQPGEAYIVHTRTARPGFDPLP